jgi:hypothetical protein
MFSLYPVQAKSSDYLALQDPAAVGGKDSIYVSEFDAL